MYIEEQEKIDPTFNCDDLELFKALQNCRDEDFKLFFNGMYQDEIGYILDAIIYTANQSSKVKTINPQITKDIKKERALVYEKNNRKKQ